MKLANKINKLIEAKDDMVTIEVGDAFELEGPKSNLSKANAIKKKADKAMQAAYDDMEDEGESEAMDARDDEFENFEKDFKKIGFVKKD